MERSGVTPPGAVVAPDLTPVLQAEGPFVTVYLTTEAEIENAAQRSELRWKALRRELAGAGATETVLAAVDPIVPEAHQHGRTLAVVADRERLLHVEHLPDQMPADVAEVGPLPRLVPLLAARQNTLPHVTVLADRTGADICVYRHGAEVVEREAGGGTDPLARSQPGGWSQLRYQHRAENTWEHNADDVAKELVEVIERYAARLVIAAGDVRAVQLIGDALPPEVVERLVVVDGSRSEDGSRDVFERAVREQVTAAVNNETMELLDKFREELGQADRAADGPDDTLAALSRAQVEVLLAAGSPDDQRTAYFGPEPTQLSRTRDDVVAMGVESPQEGPLIEVAVRATLGTGAAVRLVPRGDVPTGRLGAILRWS